MRVLAARLQECPVRRSAVVHGYVHGFAAGVFDRRAHVRLVRDVGELAHARQRVFRCPQRAHDMSADQRAAVQALRQVAKRSRDRRPYA